LPHLSFCSLNFCIFFRGKINLIFHLFEPTFFEAEGPARGGQAIGKDGAASACLPAGRGGGACRACPERSEGLPLKYSSNFFVKRPPVVKRQRCARRGHFGYAQCKGGRGERIKASQRQKFEAAAG
jgi:hypothetical protein